MVMLLDVLMLLIVAAEMKKGIKQKSSLLLHSTYWYMKS